MREVIEVRIGHIATRAQAREEAPQAANPGAGVEAASEVAEGYQTKGGSISMMRRQLGRTTNLQVQVASV